MYPPVPQRIWRAQFLMKRSLLITLACCSFWGITIQVAAQLVPYKEFPQDVFIFCLSARPAHDLLSLAKHKAIIFFY